MPRALSSNLTFFWKFIFPAFCIPGVGILTLLAFTHRQWFAPREKWFYLVSWPVACFCCLFLPLLRLKRVRTDGEFLHISNYLTETKVSLREVRSVGVWSPRRLNKKVEEVPTKPFAVVEFQEPTRFGRQIVFMARDVPHSAGPWTHPVVTELRQAVDKALLDSPTTGESTPRDLGRAREEANNAEAKRLVPGGAWGSRRSKPTLDLQERYLRSSGLLWKLFGIPGGGLLLGLVLALAGLRAAVINFLAKTETLASEISTAILLGFTLLLGAYFIKVLRFWLTAPARLVLYFERPLEAKTRLHFKKTVAIGDLKAGSEPLETTTWDAFKRGFALVKGFDVLERRASHLGVPPLSAFGFGDDLLGQIAVWHNAADGLKTVQTLLASSRQQALDLNLLQDLEALAAVLAKAETATVRFAVVVRIGTDEWISHAEMDQRKGSFW